MMNNKCFIANIFIFFSLIIIFILFLPFRYFIYAENDETTTNYNNKLSPQKDIFLSSSQLLELIKKNKENLFFSIIDLREFNKYINGHIPGSIDICYKLENFTDLIADLDRSMTYVIYSEKGIISNKVLKIMKQCGFKNVYILKGGYEEWVDKKFRTEKQYICNSKREQ